MPLLTSPIDGSPMRQIRRYGIEIDVCPASGGVWLDRGELEKIIQLIQEEASAEGSRFGPPPGGRHYDADRDDDDDRDDERERYAKRGYYGSGNHHKKEGKMSRIMDLFDF